MGYPPDARAGQGEFPRAARGQITNHIHHDLGRSLVGMGAQLAVRPQFDDRVVGDGSLVAIEIDGRGRAQRLTGRIQRQPAIRGVPPRQWH
jgi:hypothetical protein